MRGRFRIEVRFDDGRVSTASSVKAARRFVESQRGAAEIWSVWPNDLGVGTRIDRVEPRRCDAPPDTRSGASAHHGHDGGNVAAGG